MQGYCLRTGPGALQNKLEQRSQLEVQRTDVADCYTDLCVMKGSHWYSTVGFKMGAVKGNVI